MNACARLVESPILSGRCVTCGRTALAHRGLVSGHHVIGNLNETFDRLRAFSESHAGAIADVAEFFQERLATDITAAVDEALVEYPVFPTPADLCDRLAHQVEEIRGLETAGEDLDQPDLQARTRLVKLAGLATAFAELIDRHRAIVPDLVHICKNSDLHSAASDPEDESFAPPKTRKAHEGESPDLPDLPTTRPQPKRRRTRR
jgi:hypothetical protein